MRGWRWKEWIEKERKTISVNNRAVNGRGGKERKGKKYIRRRRRMRKEWRRNYGKKN